MLDNEVTKMQDGPQEPPNANCGWSWDFVQTGRPPPPLDRTIGQKVAAKFTPEVLLFST